MDFHAFSLIFVNFRRFSQIFWVFVDFPFSSLLVSSLLFSSLLFTSRDFLWIFHGFSYKTKKSQDIRKAKARAKTSATAKGLGKGNDRAKVTASKLLPLPLGLPLAGRLAHGSLLGPQGKKLFIVWARWVSTL